MRAASSPLDRMPPANDSAPVSQKQMGDGHTLHVYGPHNAAPIDQYQTRPGSDEVGPMLEQGVVPGGGSRQHEWVHTHHGEPVNGGHADSAPEAMAAAEKSHADLTGDWDSSEILGSRHEAWTGWGPDLVQDSSAHHKVAGWEWDPYLNAHVASGNPRTFTCSCGTEHPVPSYANCKCGKIWNTQVIGTGGDRHEASADRALAREIPQRKDVIVASRRYANEDRMEQIRANPGIHQKLYPHGEGANWNGEYYEGPNGENLGNSSRTAGGAGLLDLAGDAVAAASTTGQEDDQFTGAGPQAPPKTSSFDPRHYLDAQFKVGLSLPSLQYPKGGYDLDGEVEDNDPWPSDHHPDAGGATMKPTDELWHHRDKGKFTKGVKPGPGAFKKKDS